MKHQQVVVDYTVMLSSSITCIMLAIGGWVLIRLVQAVFLMPGYMKRQQDELYENLQKKADEICTKGRQLRCADSAADDDDDEIVGDDENMEMAEEKVDSSDEPLTFEVKKVK